MSYRLCLAFAALTATACGGADSTGSAAGGKMSPTPIQTSFDADIEGWSLQAFDTDTPNYAVQSDLVTTVTWDATGGNPGGSITREDLIGETDYFRPPVTFHGDLSAYYGGTIAFDLRDSSADDPFTAPLVLLQSGGMMWLYNGGPDATTGWTTFRVPLDAAAGGWTLASSGAATTDDTFRPSVAAVTGLWLRGEFSSTEDNSWLDNVSISN